MSRIPLTLSLLALSLAACSGSAPDEQEQATAQSEQRAEAAATTTPDDTAPPADATACDATQAQWIVGKTPAESDTAQARKDAGATSVRVLKPDQPVTMEFNAARLNVEVDEKGVAASVRCG